MLEIIKKLCDHLVSQFETIPENRKAILEKIADKISCMLLERKDVNLLYVCTHNSRRSHFGQIWGAVAADFFKIKNISTFSAGTEATKFNINAIDALRFQGFQIKDKEGSNPEYNVYFGENKFSVCFSKVVDAVSNPKENILAIMTCTDAEQNCPFILGSDLRVGLSYEDPKTFDETDLCEMKYQERSFQIGMECLYLFSKIKN